MEKDKACFALISVGEMVRLRLVFGELRVNIFEIA